MTRVEDWDEEFNKQLKEGRIQLHPSVDNSLRIARIQAAVEIAKEGHGTRVVEAAREYLIAEFTRGLEELSLPKKLNEEVEECYIGVPTTKTFRAPPQL